MLGNTASLSIRELLEGNLAGGLLYWELWKLGLISTQRQNQKLILDLSLTAKTTVLSFTRTQSKVVIGLIIGDYTLRRHFYLMGLTNSLFVGGMEQRKKPQPMFCVTAKLWLHSYTHVWAPFFWTQRMFKSLSQWVNQNFCKDTGLPWLGIRLWGTKGPYKGLGALGPNGFEPNYYLHLHLLENPTHNGSQGSSVSKHNKIWSQFLGSERFFTSPTLHSCSVDPLSAGCFYSGVKQMGHEADSPPSSSVKIKHVWSCTSSVPCFQ